VTLVMLVAWFVAAVLTLAQGFPATPALQAILVLAALYILALVLFRSFAR
jgi:hypothetical protein